jgi:hypothetical protein
MLPAPGSCIAVDVLAKQPWEIALHNVPRGCRADIETRIVTVWAIHDRPATGSTVPGELLVYVRRADQKGVADAAATMRFYYGDEAHKQQYLRSIRVLAVG